MAKLGFIIILHWTRQVFVVLAASVNYAESSEHVEHDLGAFYQVLAALIRCDTVELDLDAGVVRGYSRFITFLSTPTAGIAPRAKPSEPRCSRQAVVRIDLSGPYRHARLVLDYTRPPRLWTLDIGDTAGADGHGGDAANSTSNAAEALIFNRQLRLHSNALPGYRSATIDGGFLLKVVDNVVRKGSRLTLQVGNEKVAWAVGKQKDELQSKFLFTLAGQTPMYGEPDDLIYIGFNRIVDGNWRNGSGLCRATILLLREEDECILGTHQCDANAVCKNTRKAYRCRCKTGYNGDGRKCIDKDECRVRNGGCVHRCHNAVGNYSCSCHDGFQLDQDGHNCVDVNECLQNKGGCAHQCLNTLGSYECRCNDGYTIAQDGRNCNVGSWCREHGCEHGCELTRTSFICTCRPGYALTPDTHKCMPSCAVGNGGCQHRCTTTPDGPICTCHYKYILGLDKQSCTPSCAVNNGGCDRRCTTTPQGIVKCSCPNGFILHHNGKTCLDIDECLVSNGNCSFRCRNNIGSYECVCPRGYKLLPDERTCAEFDECSLNGTCDHVCINLPGSYECQCHNGYDKYGLTHCGDRNECVVNNGGCAHNCVNTPGSFHCTCRDGFHLHPNQRDCVELSPCGAAGPADARQSRAHVACSRHGCGVVCNALGHSSTSPNDSFVLSCGTRDSDSTRMCTETGTQPPCKPDPQDGPTRRRRVRYLFPAAKCQLRKSSTPSSGSSHRSCLYFGHVSFVGIECLPSPTRWSRSITTPAPTPKPASIVTIEIELKVTDEKPTADCGSDCSRFRTEGRLRRSLTHLRQVILKQPFFFTFDGVEYRLVRSSSSGSSSISSNATIPRPPSCPRNHFYLHHRCVSCAPGAFYDLSRAQCTTCPLGTYQDVPGQLGCQPCPAQYQPSLGAQNASQCGGLCPRGHYSADGWSPCLACPRGTFQPEEGRTHCLTCGPLGANTAAVGAHEFKECLVSQTCAPGHYFNTSEGECLPCPKGTYQPLAGQNFCVSCPGDTVTEFPGATATSLCKSTACGGYIGDLLGIFESPNFPADYPNNAECTWVVRARKGRRILVVVPEVFLASDKCGDVLVMRKSRSPYSVTTYETCKTHDSPIAFTARSKKLWIQFKSDGHNTASGFRIPYALFNEEYQPLIESIVRDSKLYALINHQEILKDRKLLTALMDVIAHPINYYKYANVSRAWFPDSFIRFIMSKVKVFFS